MDIHFNIDEKIRVLEANGYEVKEVTMEFSRSCYHNSVEYYDAKIKKVFKDGKELNERYPYDSKDHYVDMVFIGIYKEKIINFLSL